MGNTGTKKKIEGKSEQSRHLYIPNFLLYNIFINGL